MVIIKREQFELRIVSEVVAGTIPNLFCAVTDKLQTADDVKKLYTTSYKFNQYVEVMVENIGHHEVAYFVSSEDLQTTKLIATLIVANAYNKFMNASYRK